MVSKVLYSLVCVLCVILLPAVWADDCGGYKDTDGLYHELLQCGSQYCCGDKNKIYCCSEEESRFTQEFKESRVERLSRGASLFSILGGTFGPVSCVVIIICFVCPCCLLYKKCRERRNQRQQGVIITTLNTPQLPLLPSGYQPSHPGYQPMLVLHGHGGPPTAPPPSYLEATDPGHFPAPFPQGQLMYPPPPPGQSYVLPPHSDEFVQLPYNPSYGPNS